MTSIRAQHDPPLKVAFSQAVKSIRLRLLRQGASAMGVLLGIAFYASVRTSQVLSPANPADPSSVEAAQRLQWLAILSLVMCLVGITNSMLMSVTERYKEIGTLKCLGASDRFIVKVFFIEALMIGLFASVIGAVLGVLIVVVMRLITDGTGGFVVGFGVSAAWIILVATAVGVAISGIAAVLPAVQAAKMPAAAALRVEI